MNSYEQENDNAANHYDAKMSFYTNQLKDYERQLKQSKRSLALTRTVAILAIVNSIFIITYGYSNTRFTSAQASFDETTNIRLARIESQVHEMQARIDAIEQRLSIIEAELMNRKLASV